MTSFRRGRPRQQAASAAVKHCCALLWQARLNLWWLRRDCSTPDHIAPYEGKYNVTESTPNALAMHKVQTAMYHRQIL